MTDLVRVTDHTEQALGLLISQYQGLPRLSGLITAITNRIQECEDINWDVVNKRLLDYTALDGTDAHAVGAQLDAIGRLVGRVRGGMDNATYLTYIRAQIFLNRSRGRRGDVIRLMQLVEAREFTYSESSPAFVLITYSFPPLTASPLVLIDLAKRVVSGGVKVEIAAAVTDADHTFTFISAGDISNTNKGFGHAGSTAYGGLWAAAYE